MKKLLILIGAIVIITAMTACGGEASDVSEATTTNDNATNTTVSAEEDTEDATDTTVSVDEDPDDTVLEDYFIDLLEIVEETRVTAVNNGWNNDDAFSAEFTAVVQFLDIATTDLMNPDNLDQEYKDTLRASFEELIPAWQDYLVMASEPYTEN